LLRGACHRGRGIRATRCASNDGQEPLQPSALNRPQGTSPDNPEPRLAGNEQVFHAARDRPAESPDPDIADTV